MNDLKRNLFYQTTEQERAALGPKAPWLANPAKNRLLLASRQGMPLLRALGWWMLVPFGICVRALLEAVQARDELRSMRERGFLNPKFDQKQNQSFPDRS